MRRTLALAAAALVAAAGVGLPSATAAPVSPRVSTTTTQDAGGRFVFTTSPGILPTWDAEGIRITGVSPGSAITNTQGTSARISIPVVAVNGSAVFAAGGFRFMNTETGDFVNCATPAIDTRALVVDCVVQGTNLRLLRIASLSAPTRVSGSLTATVVYRNVVLQVANSAMAKLLNDRLDTNVFSPYVKFAAGELTITTDR